MQAPGVQHHRRKQQRHQHPVAIAVSHQEIVERRDSEQRNEALDETAARGAAAGVCEQRFVVRCALPLFAKSERATLERSPVIVQIAQHQEAVEGEGRNRERCTERPMLQDHRPEDLAHGNRHEHAQGERHEDARQDQRSRDELNHHDDIEQSAVDEGRHQLDGEGRVS